MEYSKFEAYLEHLPITNEEREMWRELGFCVTVAPPPSTVMDISEPSWTGSTQQLTLPNLKYIALSENFCKDMRQSIIEAWNKKRVKKLKEW